MSRFTQSDARRVIRSVIEKASDWGLISVEVFGLESLGEAGIAQALVIASEARSGSNSPLVALFPKTLHDALIGWIRILDPHFVEHYFEAPDPLESAKWGKRLDDAFLSHPPNDLSVTDVTLSLLGKEVAMRRR